MTEETLFELGATVEPPKGKGNRGPMDYRKRMSGSSVEQDMLENPDQVFNPAEPTFAILHERPEHVLAILLKAQGKSNADIARRLNYSQSHVSQVLRQPWARQRLMRELKEAGKDAIQELLASSAEDSVLTLIELRDDPNVKPADRISSSKDLLDRFLGKPTQRVEAVNTNLNVTVEDVSAIDRELAQLQAEEARLTGGAASTSTGASKP